MYLRRFFGIAALGLAITAILFQTPLRADNVIRKDKKGDKTVTVSGKIAEDNVAGVKIKLNQNKEESISSSDIVSVSYSSLPIAISTKVSDASEAENRRDFAAAISGYEALLTAKDPKDPKFTLPPEAKRNFEFRILNLKSMTADGENEIKTVIGGLSSFLNANPDCWQYSHAIRQLARMQTDVGDYPAATATLEKIIKSNNIPGEFKSEAASSLIDVAFLSEDIEASKKRIDAVSKDPKSSQTAKDRLAYYTLALEGLQADEAGLANVVKKIEDSIAKTKDPSLKALGYNVLGDCYLSKKRRRDAMWSYLWVDTVYNQDRAEQVKAQTRLIKIFTEEGDTDKVKLYKEKVSRSR